jgi:hypothetical protein
MNTRMPLEFSGAHIVVILSTALFIALTTPYSMASVDAQSSQRSSEPATVVDKETALKAHLFHMRAAIDKYYTQKKHYPPRLDSLVNEGYIQAIPIDPFTNSKTSWRLLEAQRSRATMNRTNGIYDVKSGSKAIALDGTKYANW